MDFPCETLKRWRPSCNLTQSWKSRDAGMRFSSRSTNSPMVTRARSFIWNFPKDSIQKKLNRRSTIWPAKGLSICLQTTIPYCKSHNVVWSKWKGLSLSLRSLQNTSCPQVIQHFHGAVGSVQTGSQNLATVVQNISGNTEVLELLNQLRQHLANETPEKERESIELWE